MIYVFCVKNKYIKVGVTSRDDIKKRLTELQTGCPFVIYPYGQTSGNKTDERKLHEALSPFKTNGGREWYKLTKETKAIVDLYLKKNIHEFQLFLALTIVTDLVPSLFSLYLA